MIQATQLLIDDHKRIRGLFRQYEAVDQRSPALPELKGPVTDEIFAFLELHARLEEELFYPAALEILSDDGKGLAEECASEHAEARKNMIELRGMKRDDERFDAELRDLIASVELHIEKEERELLLPEALNALGDQMQQRRNELLQLPELEAARSRPAQYPSGGEQKRIA